MLETICNDSDLLYLEIKDSTIKDSGKGVFAKKKFERGDLLCEYRGVMLRGPTVGTDTTRDLHLTGTDLIIRAEQCAASYVNDCIDFRKYTIEETRNYVITRELLLAKGCSYNCAYVHVTGKMFVVATKNIEIGDELFVSYGNNYWAGKLFNKCYFTFPTSETIARNLSVK